MLLVRRLAQGATSFFRVNGDRWEHLADAQPVDPGQSACIETLMNGQTLLALRVFLGTTCGPA